MTVVSFTSGATTGPSGSSKGFAGGGFFLPVGGRFLLAIFRGSWASAFDLAGPAFFPRGETFRGVQRLQGKALLDTEQARPFPDEKEVRRFFHDAPGEGRGVANVLQARHGPASQGGAVHHAGV